MDDCDGRRVLVLDADGQAGLCIIRSLGRHGVDVTAGSGEPRSLGALSRYADRSRIYPSPTESASAFVDSLVDYLAAEDYFAVLPVTDGTTAVVSRHKPRLEATGTVVGAADWERFVRTYDKAETFALAADLDVPTPETHAPSSLADVETLAETVTYPVVMKSRSKHVWGDDGRLVKHRVGANDYAADADELLDVARRMFANSEFETSPPIVQEYVPGRTVTTVGVAEDGELRSRFQELRLRTTPASGGNSTLIRGFRHPTMCAYAERVVDALAWTGPIQVEFMLTDEDCYLIEVNGRYWGSTPLAVASGVDVPWHHYCLLEGCLQRQPPIYRDDVVQQRLLYGDLKWLAEQFREGRYGALLPFARSLLDAEQVFVSVDDPLPMVGALAEVAELAANRLGLHEGETTVDSNK